MESRDTRLFGSFVTSIAAINYPFIHMHAEYQTFIVETDPVIFTSAPPSHNTIRVGCVGVLLGRWTRLLSYY